ncbi:synaptotagmin-1-like [Tachypleus tridentatus]|uniref:synaptotagmin-1-like n=1 Tax=Tachypleus tridentatus TaxID=6853 RepID=UPI003FD12F30
MVTLERSTAVSSGYYTAVYVCVSFLVVMLICLLFYVLCSRRYQLNWFEKTSLMAAEERGRIMLSEVKQAGSTENAFKMTQGISPILRSQSSGKLESPSKQSTGEFWVPPRLQRQLTTCDKVCEICEESLPVTSSTPLVIKVSPFTPTQTGQESAEKGVSTLYKYTQPSVGSSIPKPRFTSMYSKLDHNKIDAALYQEGNGDSSDDSPEKFRGFMHLFLGYDKKKSALHVNLIEAVDLVSRDFNGTADPYAKIRLLSDPEDFRQTSVHYKTLNPQFKEDFTFNVLEDALQHQTIEILLFDFDQYSRHVCLGNVQVSLQDLDLTDNVNLWKNISHCEEADENPDLGDLMVSLGYLPSAERLTVVILKARNLHPVDETKKFSDPYVKVALIQDGKRLKKKRTKTQRGTLNPVFNEALTFNVAKDQLTSMTLEITVMNDSILGQNEILGRVVIGPQSKGNEAAHMRDMLISKRAVSMWHMLIEPTVFIPGN